MRTILIDLFGVEVPSFGVLLVLAIFLAARLAARLAVGSGGKADWVYDFAFTWLLPFGIAGARLFYVIEYRKQFETVGEMFAFWNGGIVIYGGVAGAFVGFLLFTWLYKVPRLWLLDVAAPAMMLGMAIGRLGCFMNGCCYGDYCDQPWAVTFPAASDPANHWVALGSQSRWGFGVGRDGADRNRVTHVEPGTPAAAALRVGDRIVGFEQVRGDDTPAQGCRRSKVAGRAKAVNVTVQRGDRRETVAVEPRRSLAVHPTQLYSAIGAALLCAHLVAFYPHRRRSGEVIARCVVLYAVGRFLIEFLRSDEATLRDGLTISQNISVLMFIVGAGLLALIARQPAGKVTAT